MIQKRLWLLLLVTIVVLGIGLLLNRGQKPAGESSGGSSALIPGLTDQLNAVDSFKLIGAGDATLVELAKTDSDWVVVNRHRHPADIAKLREFLIKLSESTLREEKTSKPENYARLGVEDLSSAEAKGLALELGGMSNPVRVILGSPAGTGATGTYVRRADEATSHLASGALVPEREAQNWLAKPIIDIPSTRIHSVQITAPDQSVLRIEKTDPNEFNYTVLDIPRGRTLSSESAGNLIAGVLAGLNLEDVQPADQAPPEGAEIWQQQFLSYEGLVIRITGWDQGGSYYARFEAALDEDRMNAALAAEKAKADAERATALAQAESIKAAVDAAAADAGATPASDPTDSVPPEFNLESATAAMRAELDEEIAKINAQVAPWAYGLPGWKAANLKKKIEDLLQPKA